ncbi:MAG: hypothetical protein HY075_11085 [Deltaproteobacteria bacterium]|nr:hypothetical protein [Deltaproteobacteria bacterium]
MALVVALTGAGCGKPRASEEKISQVVPSAPATYDFGPLYPRVQSYFALDPPDVQSAVRDTVSWARAHLERFNDGACGSAQVVSDGEFTRYFGRTTLGVTLPWMLIYVRDGLRAPPEKFLWQDPTLFVSTVLHEFVHSAQRARQAASWLGAAGCEAASSAINSRRGTFDLGFELLRRSGTVGSAFSREERALLYRWISPIERARDEVEASLTTVRWMHDHPDDLNDLTMGGANNWAYGVQYLAELKAQATSRCFSPDDEVFAEERAIYENELPAFATELAQYEPSMRYFIATHGAARLLRGGLADLVVPAAPSGRDGARCSSALAAELPEL